jgi:uncharacterized membrane protein YfcA|tara:strand:+ start:3394 stop:3666 length:273 start_codon:yes stop_codon:yes gene_type:complete
MASQTPATYNKWLTITKSDTINIGETTAGDGNAVLPMAVYVGGAGNVVAVASDNSTAVFTAVAGSTILIQPKRVNSTSTTATAMVALYQE